MRLIKAFLFFLLFESPFLIQAQIIQDDFEGNGNIYTWAGDNCLMDSSFNNPLLNSANLSTKVLKYQDIGGQYANIRFDAGRNLNLQRSPVFRLKVYVPSSGITGNQPNQLSLKLQDATLGAPWSTQCEIIKPIILNQWQTLTFDFANDPYQNLDPSSAPPTQRRDFNRVLLQFNGENNQDHVLAYIDDFYYYDTLIPPPAYTQLIWADEFNGSGALDSTKWYHQTQLPIPGSWYNGEIQHYTNRTTNTFQSNGTMKLIAKRETFTDQGYTKQFTSARLNSKFTFTYGRMEVRAKLPTGVGTWPAIWLLGKNIDENGAYWDNQGFGTTPWPACGEIDVMEHWGSNQNYVSSAMHTPSSFGGTVNHGGTIIPSASTAFHTYAVEWTPNEMIFSVDSIIHYTYNPGVKDANTWPFDLPQYILLNIAIEASIAPSFIEDTMEIDFVRIYKQVTVGDKEPPLKTNPSIFPNPVDDQLNIKLNKSINECFEIKFYALNGQLIQSVQKTAQNGIIHFEQLSNLKKGFYFVSIRGAAETSTFKFLKR